jgi:hypothetical protein
LPVNSMPTSGLHCKDKLAEGKVARTVDDDDAINKVTSEAFASWIEGLFK